MPCPPFPVPFRILQIALCAPANPHPVARVQKIIQADPERINTSKNAAFAIALAAEMFIQHMATTTHNVVKAERKPRRNIQYRDVSSAIAKTDNLEFLVDVVPKTTTYKEFKKRQDEKEKEKAREKEREKEKEKEREKEKEAEKAAAASSSTDKGKGKAKAAAPTNGHTAQSQSGQAIAAAGSIERILNGMPTAASPTPAPVPATRNDTTEPSTPAQATPAEEDTDTPDAMDVDDDASKTQTPAPKEEVERVEESEDEDPAAMQIEMEMRGPPAKGPSASPEVRRKKRDGGRLRSSSHCIRDGVGGDTYHITCMIMARAKA